MPVNAAGERESRADRRARVAAAAQDQDPELRRMTKRLRVVKKRMRIAKRAALRKAELESACATDAALLAMPLPQAANTPPRVQSARLPPSPVPMQPFVPSELLRGSLDLVAEQPVGRWQVNVK